MSKATELHQFDCMTEPELTAFCTELGKILDWRLPRRTGFLLLMAPMGTKGVAQYLSNVQREDAMRFMEETLHRWRTGDVVPRAEWITVEDVQALKRKLNAVLALTMDANGMVRGEDVLRALEETP